MGRFLRPYLSFSAYGNFRLVLSLFWISGLLLGMTFSVFAGFSSELALTALEGSLSVFSFFFSILLPVLLTFLAVYVSKPYLLYALIFSKAFIFAFVCTGLLSVFGSAAWLIHSLFMFSDLVVLPFLWWIWLQSFAQERGCVLRLCAAAAVVVFLIGLFDYAFIAPFLADLISF